ncbi:MAG: hypothetical protein F4219_01955 [Gammaproteobacteria bacterium]|nr:hypothetical protein [Gammaproteobacteria bacterium]
MTKTQIYEQLRFYSKKATKFNRRGATCDQCRKLAKLIHESGRPIDVFFKLAPGAVVLEKDFAVQLIERLTHQLGLAFEEFQMEQQLGPDPLADLDDDQRSKIIDEQFQAWVRASIEEIITDRYQQDFTGDLLDWIEEHLSDCSGGITDEFIAKVVFENCAAQNVICHRNRLVEQIRERRHTPLPATGPDRPS